MDEPLVRPEVPPDFPAIRRVHREAFGAGSPEAGLGDAVLALAPMAVLPAFQRCGIGSALVLEALRRAAATDYAMVVVVGHPAYYPRFGFVPAGTYGVAAPWEIPGDAWLTYPLPAYRP